jgi:zinc protease
MKSHSNKAVSKYRMLCIALAFCVSLVGPKTSWAQPATLQPAEKLATAQAVLARYAEVTGGVDKYKTIEAVSQAATISLAAAGIEGKMEMKYAGPTRLSVSVDMGPAGKERSGVFDDVGWADSLVTGTRLVTGKELDQLKTQIDMRQYYDPATLYKEMELLEETEIDGQACYALKLTKENDSVEYEYYSVETGLKVKSRMTAETAMGAIPMETYYHQYKEFSGIKQPTRMTQKLPNGMELEIKVSKFEVNPEFEEGTFDLPENVKKLVEKQSK